jgi:hypothetical protein
MFVTPEKGDEETFRMKQLCSKFSLGSGHKKERIRLE